MFCICLKDLFVTSWFCIEKSGFFEAVKFQANCICRLPEFAFQIPEIGGGIGIQEKLQKKFQPCFRSDKGIEHL